MLPTLISGLHERKCYKLQSYPFLYDLTEIIDTVCQKESEFILNVSEPLSSHPQWIEFLNLYLKELDLIGYYSELEEYWHQSVKKE